LEPQAELSVQAVLFCREPQLEKSARQSALPIATSVDKEL
jgi:hypothetical protein